MLSATILQIPAGSLLVRYSTTVPEAVSAAEGVYTAVRSESSLKVPLPLVVHTELVAAPPIEAPVIEYTVPAHTVASGPAFTVAG